MNTTVYVRWWDGYFEGFAVEQVRFSPDLLWLRLLNGENRHIPLRYVRWYSIDPEQHQRTADAMRDGDPKNSSKVTV